MNLSKVKLSKDFRLLKAIETDYPLPNYPTREQLQKGYIFANHVLQPIRNGIGIMQETSFFRTLLVNFQAKGIINSQHLDFEALDFFPKDMSIAKAFKWIADPINKIQFGQLILRPTFIHVSQIRMGKPNLDVRVLDY